MLFVRIANSGPASESTRDACAPGHRAHIASGSSLVTKSAQLFDKAGVRVGALMIFEAEDMAAAEAFSARDPFVIHGVYDDVRILHFGKPTS